LGFYQQHVIPHLVHFSMRQSTLTPYRQRVLAGAAGRVLEVGIGSGLNVPLYPSSVSSVVGVEPSWKLLSFARDATRTAHVQVELVDATAEAIPIEGRSIDSVVTTWTLCTIPDVTRALEEMRRVLKPQGRLLFVEHGESADQRVRRVQNLLNPIWRPLAGGCNLNRPIRALIEAAGFRIQRIDTDYAKGLKPLAFMYEGVALPI
jgi:ubiquinone/menaquinone biosynthesis C-methylase UbiE